MRGLNLSVLGIVNVLAIDYAAIPRIVTYLGGISDVVASRITATL
jgi:hypothetical protein